MLATAFNPTPDLNSSATADEPLTFAIRDYIDAYVNRFGRKRAAEDFGVSRHTLWRLLRRGQLGRALPRAVPNTVGETVEAQVKATPALSRSLRPSSNGHLRLDPLANASTQITIVHSLGNCLPLHLPSPWRRPAVG